MEACRAAKGASGRPKDAADIGEIDRIGVDPARLGRVKAAFSRMRVECVAHEGAEGGSPDVFVNGKIDISLCRFSTLRSRTPPPSLA